MTVLELLFVMGIIGVLMALLIPALRGLSDTSKARSTRLLLSAARNMLGEMDVKSPVISQSWATGTVASPGKVGSEFSGRTGAAVQSTRDVMNKLRAMPLNAEALSQIAPSQMLILSGSDAPVLLDGWLNPIVFVPAGGMSGVTTRGTSGTVRAPDGRCFFASAGPDGDFATGDDNIYSFEH